MVLGEIAFFHSRQEERKNDKDKPTKQRTVSLQKNLSGKEFVGGSKGSPGPGHPSTNLSMNHSGESRTTVTFRKRANRGISLTIPRSLFLYPSNLATEKVTKTTKKDRGEETHTIKSTYNTLDPMGGVDNYRQWEGLL